MEFVVGYAPCGLSPQIDGMPVILDRIGHPRVALFIATLILVLEAYIALSTLMQKKEE